MKIKFGSIVVDARNKIGGHVASKNRFGSYLRTKVTPTNPRSSYQIQSRARLASLSSGFRALTQAQIKAWNDAASLFQKTDIFGDLKTNTGLQLYVGLNYNRLLIGQTAINTPPQPKQAEVEYIQGLTITKATNTMQIDLTDDVPANSYMIVAATPALSAAKNFVRSELRIIGTYDPSTPTPVDVYAEYAAKYGGIGQQGQKIFVEIWFIDTNTGIPSGKQQISALIA